jgi:hypothetical protein
MLKAKLAARIALSKLNPQTGSDLLKIPVFLLQKDESNEVWYDNKLYDVAERDRINDTVYVFLLRDEEEQNVISNDQNFFRDNEGVIPDDTHHLTTVRKVPTITDTERLSSRPLAFLLHDLRTMPSAEAKHNAFSVVSVETPAPPPRQA